MSDIDYESWYNDWMKRLAKSMTKEEIEKELGVADKEAERAANAHLNAIKSSISMNSNSQRRAHGRNAVSTAGDYKIALNGALEIHEKFPEHAKK